jgi:hypothetical protein
VTLGCQVVNLVRLSNPASSNVQPHIQVGLLDNSKCSSAMLRAAAAGNGLSNTTRTLSALQHAAQQSPTTHLSRLVRLVLSTMSA